MKRWEYQVLQLDATGFYGGKINAEAMDHELNDLGQEGWELVTSFDSNKYQGETRSVFLLFKRELQ